MLSIDSGLLPQTIRVEGKCVISYGGDIRLSIYRVTFSFAARPDAVPATDKEGTRVRHIYLYYGRPIVQKSPLLLDIGRQLTKVKNPSGDTQKAGRGFSRENMQGPTDRRARLFTSILAGEYYVGGRPGSRRLCQNCGRARSRVAAMQKGHTFANTACAPTRSSRCSKGAQPEPRLSETLHHTPASPTAGCSAPPAVRGCNCGVASDLTCSALEFGMSGTVGCKRSPRHSPPALR
jgi:hypothetical protein